MQSGRQQKLTDAFLKDAFVPALNRLGIASVGVFNLTIGPVTPTLYVLMAAASVETLATVEARLGQDAEYLKAGAPFLTSPADQAPFIRIESSLMVAFEGWPKLELAAATTEHKSAYLSCARMRVPATRIIVARSRCLIAASTTFLRTPASPGLLWRRAGWFAPALPHLHVGLHRPNGSHRQMERLPRGAGVEETIEFAQVRL